MVKLIMGPKGTGKTKTLVDLVRKAVDEENGDVICIEKDKNLTYDIPYTCRLIHAGEYGITTNDLLKGFLSGLHAGNFDISHIFIDGLYRVAGSADLAEVEDFFNWCSEFGKVNNMNFTVVVSDDPEKMPEGIRKYF